MKLFTFFLDYNGGTYVSQVSAPSWLEAVKAWVENFSDDPDSPVCLEPVVEEGFKDADPPVEIDGLENVWCVSAEVDEKLALVHFVLTEPQGAA